MAALPIPVRSAEFDRPAGIGDLVLTDTTAPVDVPAVAAPVRDWLRWDWLR